jgi:large-conductance mechanosensitive channel
MQENIYALTDKEVFQRVVPASIKKALGSIALVALTFLAGKLSRSFATYLSWLFLFCFAIDFLIVAWSTFMQLVLIVLQSWSEKARQTKYDIGASLARVVEGAIVFGCGYVLYVHFIR